MTDDPWQKLRDLGGEEITDREGETHIMFGFRRIPKTDEQPEKREPETADGPPAH